MEPSHEFMEAFGKVNGAILKNLKHYLVMNVLCRTFHVGLQGPRALWLNELLHVLRSGAAMIEIVDLARYQLTELSY